jgi:hypothetical protein
MAIQYYNDILVGAGTQIDLGGTGGAFIASGAVIGTTVQLPTAAAAISGFGVGHHVNVQGEVFGYGNAILLGENLNTAYQNTLVVGKSGYVGSAVSYAAFIGGTAARVQNDGVIEGRIGLGMHASGADEHSVIRNSGSIRGEEIGITITTMSTFEVVNDGRIEGAHALTATGGTIEVFNNGLFVGGIELAGGADIYDGREGRTKGVVEMGGGADTLRGGFYTDQFRGGAGADVMSGGKGDDVFLFADIVDSGTAAADRDLISDFRRSEHDRLDFSGIDTVPGGGDDAFTFIGHGAFRSDDAEIRFAYKGGSTLVHIDTDTDRAAEMTIELKGHIGFSASDFVL